MTYPGRDGIGWRVTHRNPFTPTFGTSPPVVGGRDHLIAEIGAALGTGPTHPAYTTLVTGERGMGKTVLLNEIEDMAHRRGWRVMDATATDGVFIEELIEGGLELLEELRSDHPRITGVQAWLLGLGGGVERSPSVRRDENVRNTALRAILKELATHFAAVGSGLLITVDEMHTADIAETRRFRSRDSEDHPPRPATDRVRRRRLAADDRRLDER